LVFSFEFVVGIVFREEANKVMMGSTSQRAFPGNQREERRTAYHNNIDRPPKFSALLPGY